ncbi:DUF4214 domain-containing protein [Prochlorococcus sp. MIT 1011]|uniref:DUF4214 domain-containing protein n=1 Tax=Prochlorococcus sp. MIT 1011 TaxID=3082520 RepID=UPI0039B5DB73
MANATSTELQELYVAYFGRAADPTGLDYWTEQGITTAAFAADMYAQAEFKDAYGSKSVEAQVNQIYKNLFDREADVTGLTYWTQQINLGVLKVAEIATHLIWAAKNNDGSSDDKTALTNRTNAAVAYTAEVKGSTAAILAYQAESTSPWASGVNITEGVTYLSGIDKDTAHTAAGVTASVNKIVSNGDPSVVAGAKTFALTTAIDTGSDFTGTAGNDTFNADNSAAGGTDSKEVTSVADTIDGGAGTDTFNIYSDGTVAAIPTVKNVETLNVYDEDVAFTLTSDQASITTANFIRGDGAATYTVPITVTSVGLENITVSGTGIVIAAAATDTAITLGLNKVAAAAGSGDNDEDVAVTGAKLTTINVNATGTASTLDDLDLAAATTINLDAAVKFTTGELVTTGAKATLNITGAGAVDIGTLGDTITTVAAGDATGAITMTGPGSNNKSAVITLGSAADVFTTGLGGFTATTDKFAANAGAGEDILVVADAAHVNTADEADRYTNFDVIQVAAGVDTDTQYLASTIDAAKVTNANLTNMTAALAGNITIEGANHAGGTFSLKDATGSSDVLSITSKHATAASATDFTTATVTGFETLNFTANSGDALTTADSDRAAVSFTSAGDLKTINVKGTKSAAVDISSNAVKVTTLDASAITGGAVVTTGGQTGDLTVTGSAVSDTLTVGTVGSGGSVTVNAGGGIDTYQGTIAQLAAATIDAGAGVDVVNFSNTTASGTALTFDDTTLNGMSNVETLGFTGAIAGDFTVTLGGWANSLATAISGNQLKISAKALASAAATEVVVVDASQLTGSNSVEMDIKDTAAGASAANTIDLTGSDNADKITVEEATDGADTVITVISGKGNDTVTVKTHAGQDGAVVVTAGDGDDTITLSAAYTDAASTANLITGGKGTDTITLDTGDTAKETDYTIVMGSTAANNGVDSITNFEQGASGDVLKPDAFLDASAMTAARTANTASSTDVTSNVNLLVDITGGQDITTAAGLDAALAAGGEYGNLDMSGSGKAVFVTASSSDASTTQHVFFASSAANGTITTTKVATVASLDIDDWHSDNFCVTAS